jgi:hypothetical protein
MLNPTTIGQLKDSIKFEQYSCSIEYTLYTIIVFSVERSAFSQLANKAL